MTTFLTTDTHLGHGKMVEYCGWPENHSSLILDGLKVIGDDDTLIHLGDVCIGDDIYWHDCFRSAATGWRILIRGNHDKKTKTWYLRNGWRGVYSEFTMEFNGLKIVLSHEPLPFFEGDLNIHGHWHNNDHRSIEVGPWYDPKRYFRLSIEEENYKPVTLEEIISRRNKVIS